ncbi:MAG: hypothetical protein U1E61_17615 [Bradyrhizobium sp.]
MKWMRERDLLIAQTMAFVQSVTGKQPEAEIFAQADLPAVTPTRLPDVEAMLADTVATPEPQRDVPLARPVGRGDYPNEIRARVEKFRAHQARLDREREAYCSATMAKMQAKLDKTPRPK